VSALPNNLKDLRLPNDEQLVARYPTLNTYLPRGQADWSAQREAAAIEAQETFWSITGVDPEWAVPENVDHWASVLSIMTLVIIFRGFRPTEAWAQEAERWGEIAEAKLKLFRYREDENRDGVIEEHAEDVSHMLTTIPLRR